MESSHSEPMTIANFFFATRIGQIRNCISYINQTGKRNNYLIILSPERDASLRASMRSSIPDEVFERVSTSILPNYPASPKGIFRRRNTYRAMEATINEIIEASSSKMVHLHLHHANTYYPYIIRILSSTNIEIVKTTMVEEGIETYKWASPPFNLDAYGFRPSRLNWDIGLQTTTIIAFKRIANSLIGLLKAIKRVFFALVNLPFALLSCLAGKDLKLLLLAGKDRLLPKRYRFGIIEYFDDGWFCYPERMASSQQAQIAEVQKLDIQIDPLPDEEKAAANALPATVFASQKYGKPEVYYETVFTILEEMGVTDVYFKLHPREDRAIARESITVALANHPSLTLRESPRLDGVTLESILADGHFSHLIGLTSTTLFYAEALSDDLRCTSIGNRFAEVYPVVFERIREETASPSHLRQFERDLEIFTDIARRIPQFEAPKKEDEA